MRNYSNAYDYIVTLTDARDMLRFRYEHMELDSATLEFLDQCAHARYHVRLTYHMGAGYYATIAERPRTCSNVTLSDAFLDLRRRAAEAR